MNDDDKDAALVATVVLAVGLLAVGGFVLACVFSPWFLAAPLGVAAAMCWFGVFTSYREHARRNKR